MPAPATTSAFLDVARKSRQIDNDQLDAFLQEQGASLPDDPRKLAGRLIRAGLMTIFQAEQFLQGKYKGFTLGQYRFLERLGIGGTGTVYLAEHQVMKRRVAVKVLPANLAEDPAILERFRREAQAAAVLSHPNVVHVFDLCQEGNVHYIVMEHIDGPDLQRLIERRGSLAVEVACNYIRQAAEGLQHAHEANLVHRDVKPGNLLVDAAGTVKLLDLGLVRLEVRGEASVTHQFNNGQVLGTADYLAPEQALNLHDVDSRADIYSLGATFYTLLTGQPPFHAGSVGQKLLWHQVRMPDPVNSVRPDVPTEVSDIIMRMLAKKPEQRYTSMAEVVDALAPWAAQADREQLCIGPQTRADLRIGGPATSALKAQTTRRAKPPGPAGETLVACAKADTAKIQLKEAPPATAPRAREVPDLTLGDGKSWKRVALLGGVSAAVFTLVVGVIAFLVWGPKP
jgi:serine/threonine protein kinase